MNVIITFFTIIAVIIIGLLIVLIYMTLSKRQNMVQLLAEADVSNRRFKAAMQYIPCDVYQFDLDTEKLSKIDKVSGDKVDIPLSASREKLLELFDDNTLHINVVNCCKTLKKRILSGEDSIVEMFKGYSKDRVCWGKFTVTTVYNSVATPVQAICILEEAEESSEESLELKNKLTAALKSTYNEVYEIDMETETIISLYQSESGRERGDYSQRFNDFITFHANQYVHPDSRNLFIQTLNKTNLLVKLKGEGTSIYFECDVKEPKNGEYHHYSYLIQKVAGTDNNVLVFMKDITKEIKEKEFLIKKSQVDPLTGLYNKEAFYEEGQKRINANVGKECAVIFMDLDNFKSLNDTYGHFKGDEAIVEAATKLKVLFSNQDIVARFGGDEFCVLYMDVSKEKIIDQLELLSSTMREDYDVGKGIVHITTSMGVATVPKNGTNLRKLTKLADQALYHAKENGKNMFVLYEGEMEAENYVKRNE